MKPCMSFSSSNIVVVDMIIRAIYCEPCYGDYSICTMADKQFHDASRVGHIWVNGIKHLCRMVLTPIHEIPFVHHRGSSISNSHLVLLLAALPLHCNTLPYSAVPLLSLVGASLHINPWGRLHRICRSLLTIPMTPLPTPTTQQPQAQGDFKTKLAAFKNKSTRQKSLHLNLLSRLVHGPTKFSWDSAR